MIQTITDFEEVIFDNLRTYGRNQPRTSAWILGHLATVKSDYPYQMWKLYQPFADLIRHYTKPPSYLSFCRVVYELAREGKITPVAHKPCLRNGPILRTYYKLT